MVFHALVQETTDQYGRQQADRRVDEEDPTPADGRGDDAANRRANHRGSAPHSREQALDPGALLALEDVTDDGERDRLNGSRAETLDGPEQDEQGHRTGKAAQHRPTDEEREPGHEDRLAAEHVGQASVERDGDG
jgi:hypothetical protein